MLSCDCLSEEERGKRSVTPREQSALHGMTSTSVLHVLCTSILQPLVFFSRPCVCLVCPNISGYLECVWCVRDSE